MLNHNWKFKIIFHHWFDRHYNVIKLVQSICSINLDSPIRGKLVLDCQDWLNWTGRVAKSSWTDPAIQSNPKLKLACLLLRWYLPGLKNGKSLALTLLLELCPLWLFPSIVSRAGQDLSHLIVAVKHHGADISQVAMRPILQRSRLVTLPRTLCYISLYITWPCLKIDHALGNWIWRVLVAPGRAVRFRR